MIARRTYIVRRVTKPKCRFCGNQRLVAAALERFAQNAFGFTSRIKVGCVEHAKASVKADVEQPPSFRRVGRTPSRQAAVASECASAKAQGRYSEARGTETTIIHCISYLEKLGYDPMKTHRCSGHSRGCNREGRLSAHCHGTCRQSGGPRPAPS